MKRTTLTLAVTLLGAAPAYPAFDDCRDEFPNQTPPVVERAPGMLKDLCFDGFAVLHSGESKTPVFAIERMNRSRLIDAQDEERTDRFYEEARLPLSHRARLEDYQGSGYDRGHMAPAADMPTPEAMAQSFSLANMTPQVPRVNRVLWSNSVEDATRKYVMRATGNVFVFTGVVFSEGMPAAIGPGQVWVPSHLYKLVYDEDKRQAWAHWVANSEDARMGKPITYEELVARTGIDFLRGIPLAAPTRATQDTEATCGSKRLCSEMSSCAEARYYLENCGLTRLDRDRDGVPCESLCR